MKKTFFVNILLVGFTSLFAQIFLIRELMAQFQGNELSAGLTIGAWLFWTGTGSILLHRVFLKTFATEGQFKTFQMILASMLPLTFFFIQWLFALFNIQPGSVIPLPVMLIITGIAIGPICLVSGALFTHACILLSNNMKGIANPVRKVYLIETIGATIGGISATFLFKITHHLFLIFLLLIAVHVGWTFCQLLLGRQNRRLAIIVIFSIFAILVLFSIRADPVLEKAYDRMRWKTGRIAKNLETPYGKLSVVAANEQFQYYLDGALLFTNPDPFSAENAIHPALLSHPAPKTICMIGPGNLEFVAEVVKHPSVREVDYIVPDRSYQQMITALRNDTDPFLHDSRINFMYKDGRHYLNTCSKQYDVILLLHPQPLTLRDNRFYTIEFFNLVKQHLTPNGIFTFPVAASGNYIGSELSDYLGILYHTLISVFPNVAILPGETGRFIANPSDEITTHPDTLVERLKSRKLNVKYLTDYFIPVEYSSERTGWIMQSVRSVPAAHQNRDFHPAAFTQLIAHWAVYNSVWFETLFEWIQNHRFVLLIFFLCVITCISFRESISRKSDLDMSGPVLLASIGVIGFSEISLEIILILALQIFIGQAYQFVALIVTGYMLGLLAGSGVKFTVLQIEDTRRIFICIQGIFTLFVVTVTGALNFIHGNLSSSFAILVLLTILIAGAGFIGGFQFVLGNSIYQKTRRGFKQQTGILYGADLIGSSFGSIMTTLLLIPVFGINNCLFVLAVLNGWMFIILLIEKRMPFCLLPLK